MTALLLEAQVNVAQADGAGKTALHFAAKRVCSPYPASHNPIFLICVFQNFVRGVELLCARGAPLMALDNLGYSALHEAAESGAADAIAALCAKGTVCIVGLSSPNCSYLYHRRIGSPGGDRPGRCDRACIGGICRSHVGVRRIDPSRSWQLGTGRRVCASVLFVVVCCLLSERKCECRFTALHAAAGGSNITLLSAFIRSVTASSL
jgi:hypothetical protein